MQTGVPCWETCGDCGTQVVCKVYWAGVYTRNEVSLHLKLAKGLYKL